MMAIESAPALSSSFSACVQAAEAWGSFDSRA